MIVCHCYPVIGETRWIFVYKNNRDPKYEIIVDNTYSFTASKELALERIKLLHN